MPYSCDVDGCLVLVYRTSDGSGWRKIMETYGLAVAVAPPVPDAFPEATVLSPGFSHHYRFSEGSYRQVRSDGSLEGDPVKVECKPIVAAFGGC